MTALTINEQLESHLRRLLQSRDYPKTICPSEVPRSLTIPELNGLGVTSWRDLMDETRAIIWRLRDEQALEILQHGQALDDGIMIEDVKGPIRIRKKYGEAREESERVVMQPGD